MVGCRKNTPLKHLFSLQKTVQVVYWQSNNIANDTGYLVAFKASQIAPFLFMWFVHVIGCSWPKTVNGLRAAVHFVSTLFHQLQSRS